MVPPQSVNYNMPVSLVHPQSISMLQAQVSNSYPVIEFKCKPGAVVHPHLVY